MVNETNSTDKREGKKAIGHGPISKWGRQQANGKSRRKAKAALRR